VFSAVLNPNVTPTQVITNNAQGRYDTLPGSDANQRTKLFNSNNVNTTVVAPSVVKTVFVTSDPGTETSYYGPETDLTIGEIVAYRIRATFTEGLSPSAVMTDQLPTAGSRLVPITSTIISVGGNIVGVTAGTTGTITDSNADTFNDRVTWNLGNVTNIADNVSNAADQVEFEVTAIVIDNPLNVGGLNNVTNTATLSWTGSPSGNRSGTVNVDFVEPALNVVKSINTPTADANDLVTYTLVLSHATTSSAPARTINIVDLMPPGVRWVDDSTVVSSLPGLVVDSSTTPTVRFSLPELLVGQVLTLTYQGRVVSGVPANSLQTNTVSVQYDSLRAWRSAPLHHRHLGVVAGAFPRDDEDGHFDQSGRHRYDGVQCVSYRPGRWRRSYV
jgi:fimbrial isopeptide formation D2 family protein/uncharacterized repeat protein (TIGR01451 family)